VLWYAGADVPFGVVYVLSSVLSGAVIAGLLSWLLARAIARTGALSRFASGRESTARV
jgi:energy-coupling factor transport system substrate-specific component